MRINLLTVIYNSSLSDSITLKSLLDTKLDNIELNLIIWNNGPTLLEENDINDYLIKSRNRGIATSVYQDIRNLSLSKIYNNFIYKANYDFFVIFDQDSKINLSFFENIYSNSQYALMCHDIYPQQNEGTHQFPSDYEKKEIITPLGEFTLGNIRTINSGTAISKNLINTLNSIHHYVFDEKFAVYHTDHRFFDLIHDTPQSAILKGICIGQMQHDMTCELSLGELSERARLEIAYAKMLLRMFRKQNPQKQIRRNLFYAYKMKKKDNLNFISFLKLIKCVITKQHPRSRMNIEKNIRPTNTNY